MIAALLLLVAVPAGRETIGVHGAWGAFRDRDPRRCFAIARPGIAGGERGGFASVATWPDRRLVASFHVRLSRLRDRSAPVTLSIGERRFVLSADDRDAWAPDGPSDRAIVAAMRSARSMSVEGVGANEHGGGRPFAEVYLLAGAATAIDAATLACAGR